MSWSEAYLQKKISTDMPAPPLTEPTKPPVRGENLGSVSSVSALPLESPQEKFAASVGDPTSRVWRIHFPDREPVEVSCTPAATHDQILAEYPGAIGAEPFTPVIRRPSAPLTAKEEAAILAWLAHIDETAPEGIADVLTGCRDDADCRGYYLERSKEVPAKPGMVSCGECRSFQRFDYHPHLGTCTKGGPMAPAGAWDTDRRWCRVFQAETTQPQP